MPHTDINQWNTFKNSGKIEDYLTYAKSREDNLSSGANTSVHNTAHSMVYNNASEDGRDSSSSIPSPRG